MADTETTRQLVNQFWAAMQTNDWATAAALFADDYMLHWPQSGERISGAANFVAINSAYPAAGRWSFTVERLVVQGEQAVTDVVVSDGALIARAITFTTVRDGRIVAQVEYWPDPFDAPVWRAAWVERAIEQPAATTTGCKRKAMCWFSGSVVQSMGSSLSMPATES